MGITWSCKLKYMYLNTITDGRINTVFFFNIKAAQHFSKASLINHT